MNPAPLLEARDLRLIRAIVLEGSTARAARSLGLTQSAVSHQLKHMEERLTLDIFAREGRRLVLTAPGERLFERSLEILNLLGEVERSARAADGPKFSSLRVATQCFTAYHWLPQAMSALRAKHPNVRIQLQPPSSRDPMDALLHEELDCALTIAPQAHPRLVQKPLFVDELALVVAPQHPLAQRRSINGADLVSEQMFLHEQAGSAVTQVRQALFPDGGSLSLVTRLPLTDAIVELVKAGHGCSIVAKWTVAPQLARGELCAVALTPRRLKRPWVACYRKDSKLTAPIQTLLQTLRRNGARLPCVSSGD